MLLQSRAPHADEADVFELRLLPALPETWSRGRVQGMRARGGFTVALDWSAENGVRARVRFGADRTVTVRHGDWSDTITGRAGEEVEVRCALAQAKSSS
jgi:alpha-L-fucosidase 2